jgi:23S rRNA pseudouridine1911/1915/1917 synthase
MEQFSRYVLANNHHYIVVNKPGGIPVQDDPTGDTSLHATAEKYCKCLLHLVHRIDRPVSGCVVFAKSAKDANAFRQWLADGTVIKNYVVFTEGAPPQKEGTLIHWLQQNPKTSKAYVTDQEVPGSVKAQLQYETWYAAERYTCLFIHTSTGRFHQIRAQLAAIGCPVKGDVKYGARRSNADRTIHLHALSVAFPGGPHGSILKCIAPLPQDNLWALVPAHLITE